MVRSRVLGVACLRFIGGQFHCDYPSKLYCSCVNIIAGSILGSINDVFTFRLPKTDPALSDTNYARYGHRTEYVFEQYEKFSHRGKQLT